MASFHFSAQIIGRAKGRSALAAAAYRSASLLRDETTGAEFDYRRRSGVVHAEIMLPEGAAPWLGDRQKLWSHVHQIERRVDAQLCREFNLALPHELSDEQRRSLIRDFVQDNFVARGMVADLAIHAPTDNDPRNHHAHVMVTLRKATAGGLYRVKTREWNSDSLLNEWREAWAVSQNRALKQAQHASRVDHRTLAAQREEALLRNDRMAAAALARDPEIHVGPRAQRAGQRPEPPRSRVQKQALARPQAGTWRSSSDADKRVRAVDYERIDRGTRASYNAGRTAVSAAMLGQLVAQLQRRDARLRLIEVRYAQRIRGREDVLQNILRERQTRFRVPADLQRLASLEILARQQLAQYRRRSQLIRLLLGRADRILSGMFRIEALALTRTQTMKLRLQLQPRVAQRQGPTMHQAMGMRWL